MRRYCRSCGYILTAAGIFILSALALPAVCVWFAIGLILLLLGLRVTRRRR